MTKADIHRFDAQLNFVCGKGGVGKSVFSCTLAKFFVEQGHHTLLVQVNAEDSHSRLLGLSGITSKLSQMAPSLWAVNVTPDASLHEYLLLKLRSERIYRLVFDNPVMHSFLKFTPSLAELNMLGKIWYHAEQKNEQGGSLYGRIVIDCPATGHGFRFLRVAQTTFEGVQRGAIAEEAHAMAKTLADGERTRLHLVTLPEEIPVNESLELVRQVQKSKVAELGCIVVNGVLKSIFTADMGKVLRKSAKVMEQDAPAITRFVEVSLDRLQREEAHQREVARVRAQIPQVPKLLLPQLEAEAMGPSAIGELAKVIQSSLKGQTL